VTRWTKLGGGALVFAVVCLAGWFLVGDSALSSRLRRHLPRAVRKFFTTRPAPSPRLAKLPKIYLWAWERPEDMQFLGNRKVGVAFLAKTIYLTGSPSTADGAELEAAHIRPRMQPLRIVPFTPLMAVVRIESLRGALPGAYANNNASPASFSSEQTSRIANEIAATTKIEGVNALQIDFDATTSEHAFYRDLLLEVRKLLPTNFPLSITALASWCIGDRWLAELPPDTIDEAVPMLFRMGSGTREVTSYFAASNNFTVSACTTSLGLSTDEPFSRDILAGKIAIGDTSSNATRVYIFSPHSWEQSATQKLLEEYQSWRAN
jgi:hypothetical protein